MVAGQYPKREWRDSPDGQIRTIEAAVEIAKKHGVVIPDDISFHVDESGELHKDFTARGSRVDKPCGERVYWSDLVHDMHEILTLRPFLERGEISIDDYVMHTEPGRSGNLHDEAWDVADRMVDKMRGVPPQ